MLKRLSSALFASALLMAADSATTSASCKPPDLPLNTKESCVPQWIIETSSPAQAGEQIVTPLNDPSPAVREQIAWSGKGPQLLMAIPSIASNQQPNGAMAQKPIMLFPEPEGTTVYVPMMMPGYCGPIVSSSQEKTPAIEETKTSWCDNILKWFDDTFGGAGEANGPDVYQFLCNLPHQLFPSSFANVDESDVLPLKLVAANISEAVFGMLGMMPNTSSGSPDAENAVVQTNPPWGQVTVIPVVQPEVLPAPMAHDWCYGQLSPACRPAERLSPAQAPNADDRARLLASRESCFGTCQPASPEEKPLDAAAFKVHAAQRFWEIGNQCAERGDFDMACNCYDEATRICPDSEIGKKANVQMQFCQLLGALKNFASGNGAYFNNSGTSGSTEAAEPPLSKEEMPPDALTEARRILESHRMLQMGQRFQRLGDLSSAARCYEDATVVCPASRDGQQALDRLRDLQVRRNEGGSEEQEPPLEHRRQLSSQEFAEREKSISLFLQAEHALRDGKLDAAYGLFQETHLAFPDGYYGMKAIERLHEIETRRLPQTNGGQLRTENEKPRLQTLLWYDESW